MIKVLLDTDRSADRINIRAASRVDDEWEGCGGSKRKDNASGLFTNSGKAEVDETVLSPLKVPSNV
eukprot:CAMPEP_0194067908 /NCGR_PEP_ID=MMETSP0009_2-20130614/86807_1 /TAXON_ID=210454 /ORGANISM="Grammatophora oceanica, Strain CCMP 410" /LENGTH=65 /DNA_ID=CAMNT_0038720959 /DNA_START=853 /DNA_END=1048 /DNA_ORIENTATION=-